MKHILLSIILLIFSEGLYAQKDVTKFLNIPVDGSKTAMTQKLKAKGFQYNSTLDCLEGEFNGRDVQLGIVTNKNKVCRIVVADAVTSNESDIKIRFNKLCLQFLNNKKYMPVALSDYPLSDEEDISYEISVHNKRYEAVYLQSPEIADSDKRVVWFMIKEQYGRYSIIMYYDNEYNHSDGEDL